MEEQYKFEIWEEFDDKDSPSIYVFLKAIDQSGNAYLFDGEGHSRTNALRVRVSKRLNESERKKHAINRAKKLIYGPEWNSIKRDSFNDREEILNSGKFQWRNAILDIPCLHPDSEGDKKREAHQIKLYVKTKEYGCMEGFYYRGVFMKNYACPILNVVEWVYLPD